MKMRKIFALLLIAVMAGAALTSCGKKKNQPENEQIVTNEATSDKKDVNAEKSDEPEVKEEAKEKVEKDTQPQKSEEKQEEKKAEKAPEKKEDKKEEEKVFTPTFMYFISSKDAGFDATNAIIEDLKKEYKGKINFDIKNIDENPELVDNFPVGDGNTPTLIMLNTKNEISNILFKTSDKEKLKQAIEAAMK